MEEINEGSRQKGTTDGAEAADAGVVNAGEKEKEPAFKMSGQVITAIVVAAVAGNIVGARRLRTTLANMAARSAKRKEETERTFREARERGRRADAAFNGNPLRGRLPEGWEFDDGKEAAFAGRQLNSRVLRNLSTLGVNNFVAGKAEVRAAYFERAKRLHPDIGTDSALGGGTKHGNEEEFKRVAAAYEWLEDHYFRKR